MSKDTIEDPIFNYRIHFKRQKGDVLKMEIEVDPGGGVSIPHFHPRTEERFTVKQGEVTFTADGERIVAGPDDPTVVVPPGVRHGFENTGEGEAQMAVEAEPALELRQFLTDAAAMAAAGKYTKRGIPKPGTILESIEWLDRYRDTVVITSVTLPPARLQPALLGPVARFQRWRKGRPAEA